MAEVGRAPELNEMATRYVEAFASSGSAHFVANLETKTSVLKWGHHLLPLTRNDGEKAKTFVCSPVVGYVDYPKEELRRFQNKAIAWGLRIIVGGVGAVLKLSDLNRVIHINNWMMSTTLPVDLDCRLTREQTRSLASLYPSHVLAMRSLNRRHSDVLINSLQAAGWVLVPSRQVYLVEDVAVDSLTRRDSKNDQKVWNATQLHYQELAQMNVGDADRIAVLYQRLYLEKYSAMNPGFTSAFIQLTHDLGLIKYLVFRDSDGHIQSFGGLYQRGNHATMPLMGYDTKAPQELGLYRLACHAGSLYAARHKLQLNMSSGAALYKRTRGAKPEMEFTAYYLRHLPWRRRFPVQALRLIANGIGIPVLRRYEL